MLQLLRIRRVETGTFQKFANLLPLLLAQVQILLRQPCRDQIMVDPGLNIRASPANNDAGR
ncbi:hypothetical protein [Rhizobium sp. FKY42]|uniref:hypothetical protein n=1 Tax=Rhizobium sp. FKY42 TaxID=2562310 RepID=UPI001FED8FEE|nr:hypothetical protein [Rhizobium sp. FKY42]